ncbi:oxidoreductase [Aquimarina algicola]|uniref:Oxidoreductase n=1 Tax=Aquimarina algicola TaxID=2589995 RepID=A0A504IX20_9FLAO|nr:oxidoreductase [Aquimarina algicola]TPN83027.1 oxidoreductase [Aquimarina algicola]
MTQKIILITGASSGIGKETAKTLINEGHIVYAAARRLQNMKDLKEIGGLPLQMDITEEQDIIKTVNTIIDNHKKIDILINNAGYAIYGAVEDTTISDARRQFEVNLFGLAKLTQLILPHMRNQKSGKIINISSIGGKMYTPLGAWYHATKHALEGWSDCLRLELKQFGIDVIIIEPGAIQTEFGDVMTAPMIKRSGNTAYKDLAEAIKKSTIDTYNKTGGGSPSSVIAKLILKSIKARRPKTRYSAGKYAKPLLFIRKYFGDRFFDKVIMSQVK